MEYLTKILALSNKAKKSYDSLIKYAEYHDVDNLSNYVLFNPDFLLWSASSTPGIHHYGIHGLLLHTEEVVRLSISTAGMFNADYGCNLNLNEVFLAALYHDIGKIYDYTHTDITMLHWQATPHKYNIHHIARSAIIWSEQSAKVGYKNDNILHAILAHHGQKEWGSPVTPHSKLAWVLHLCDSLSARLNDSE